MFIICCFFRDGIGDVFRHGLQDQVNAFHYQRLTIGWSVCVECIRVFLDETVSILVNIVPFWWAKPPYTKDTFMGLGQTLNLAGSFWVVCQYGLIFVWIASSFYEVKLLLTIHLQKTDVWKKSLYLLQWTAFYALESALPGCVIWKHSDQSIPLGVLNQQLIFQFAFGGNNKFFGFVCDACNCSWMGSSLGLFCGILYCKQKTDKQELEFWDMFTCIWGCSFVFCTLFAMLVGFKQGSFHEYSYWIWKPWLYLDCKEK